jgi:hypothetical protein
MHIPKAFGSSLILALSQAISREVPVACFDHVLFGGFTAFDTFSARERERIIDDPAAMPLEADFVAGHFAYTTLRQAYPQAQLVTVLREPMTRLMSLWMFWRKSTMADLSGLGLWADYVRRARQPLGSFLADPQIAAQTDNMTLRQLLWPHPRIPCSGFIPTSEDKYLLRLARHRLADFAFAGVAELPNLPQSIANFLDRPFTCPRLNETNDIPPELRTPFASELDSTTLDLLATRSRLDLALWAAAAGLPAQALAKIRQQTILQHVARYSALMGTYTNLR